MSTGSRTVKISRLEIPENPRLVRGENKPFRIFLSYKAENKFEAKELWNILSNFSNFRPEDERLWDRRRAEFFLCENIPEGTRYRDTLNRQLKLADMFILLYTNPSKRWDWCLYEAGRFDATRDPNQGALVCIHHSETSRPSALAENQSVKIRRDDLTNFLKNFCRQIHPFLHTVIEAENRNAFEEASDKITNSIIGTGETVYYCKKLTLRIADEKQINPDYIPPDATVDGSQAALSILGFATNSSVTWEEVEERAKEQGDTRWIKELPSAICQAYQRRLLISPLQAFVPSKSDHQVYRATVHRVDRVREGPVISEIILAEDVGGQYENAPSEIKAMLTAINMATRFRYEVIARYAGRLTDECSRFARRVARSGAKHVREDIRSLFFNIEKEALSRGLLDEDAIVGMFYKVEDKSFIREAFTDWFDTKNALFVALRLSPDDNVCTTVNDDLITQQEMTEIENSLGRLDELNREFMQRATLQFRDMANNFYT